MSTKIFQLLFLLILVCALIIRLLPARNNNFYFTMDQGNDAVHIREIVNRHKLLLLGPETGIRGLFAGPLWYYFTSIGYLLFAGHPAGSVFMLIVLNVTTTAVLMLILAKKVSPIAALVVGFSLQFFWWFYDASRYGFNPFPLVPLSIILLILLTASWQGKSKYLTAAAIPAGLTFHAEVAASVAIIIFYLLSSLILVITKKIPLKFLFLGVLTLSLFFIPHLISELKTNFAQTQTLIRQLQEPQGVAAKTNFVKISEEFMAMVSDSTIPQLPTISPLIFLAIISVYLRLRFIKNSQFVTRFLLLSICLLFISWLFFALTTGWRVWQTVYIQPLLFTSLLLVLTSIITSQKTAKIIKNAALSLIFIILASQLLFFQKLYIHFLSPANDPGLLTNQLAAIDWIYQNAQGSGFWAYSYVPSVLDWHYQYLFWWHGTKKYGYIPCEYSTFPKTPSLFVPGYQYYQEPKRDCSNLRYLIIEPDQRQASQDLWLKQTTQDTILLEEASFGNIRVEKRQL